MLVTGAFGNLGLMVVEELARRGIATRAIALPGARARRIARRVERRLGGRVEVVFGDVCDGAWLERQVDGVDAVIHLAAILPPASEADPGRAEAVNVSATAGLVAAIERSPRRPILVYPSSLTVFGVTREAAPPRRVGDPVVASDVYTGGKIAVERMLAASSIAWVVLRVGVSVDARTLAADAGTLRQMVRVRGDNRMEWVHPADVAVALVNAALRREAVAGRVLLCGGGARCQVRQADLLGAGLGALGLGWSAALHGQEEFYTDWLDTAESERLLEYQRRSFDDYRREMARRLRWARWALWPLRPVIERALWALARRVNRPRR